MNSVYLIDGNKLKEKARPVLIPTDMEPCGHIPSKSQAVMVSEIEGMLYRESVELVRCKDCAAAHPELCHVQGKAWCARWNYEVPTDGYCYRAEKTATE